MNKVPMSMLVNALLALRASHARLMNGAAPDPYMQVVKAMHELEYAIKSFEAVEVSDV